MSEIQRMQYEGKIERAKKTIITMYQMKMYELFKSFNNKNEIF